MVLGPGFLCPGSWWDGVGAACGVGQAVCCLLLKGEGCSGVACLPGVSSKLWP